MKHQRKLQKVKYYLLRFFRWTSRLNVRFSTWFIHTTETYVSEYEWERSIGLSMEEWWKLESITKQQKYNEGITQCEHPGCEHKSGLTVDHRKKPGEDGFSNNQPNLMLSCLWHVDNPGKELRFLKVK